MKKLIRKLLKKLFFWIFSEEISALSKQTRDFKDQRENYESQEKRIKNLLGNIDVSVDVHQYSPSWAVISIQGQKADYIKFVDLGERDIREIQRFLNNFDRSKVDCAPQISQFFKIPKY